MSENYDVIIIGTGAGGGTLAHRLAPSGKKILVLERGSFLPREKENWDTISVFQKERYHTTEHWRDHKDKSFRPGTGYWVGGNTKVYGAALLRLREKDFGVVNHKDGISPAWPLNYNDFEPYYTMAEKLYSVHGKRGIDATEPHMNEEYPYPPVSHDRPIQELHDNLVKKGYNPFYLPLGVRLNEDNASDSSCIRCDTCDGFPCLVDAKADSDTSCLRPALKNNTVTLLTNTKVLRLRTSPSGREISHVEAVRDASHGRGNGEKLTFSASIVVVACGAVNSSVLLLASSNDKHPSGLANSSDQVGRNFMKHVNGAMLALSFKSNPSVFQKTMAVNDFYWGERGYDYPMGHVQLLGKANKEMLMGDAPSFTPGFILNSMAKHSIDWWFTTEDLPDPNNRVSVKNGDIYLQYKENNTASFKRLVRRWTGILKKMNRIAGILPGSAYLKKKIPLAGVAHQVGTCRFGTDPKTSVLDSNCRSHDVDNLYVIDGSFFPSSAAVNPSLTIMANALRVGDHILDRLKS